MILDAYGPLGYWTITLEHAGFCINSANRRSKKSLQICNPIAILQYYQRSTGQSTGWIPPAHRSGTAPSPSWRKGPANSLAI